MARSRDTSKDYEVGYRRPPRKNQWRKGQSGNSAGRPRRTPALPPEDLEGLELRHAEILRAMRREVTMDVGGHPTEMSVREAVLHSVIGRVLGGDLRPLKLLLEQTAEADTQLARAKALRAKPDYLDIIKLNKMIREYPDLKRQVEEATAAGFIPRKSDAVTAAMQSGEGIAASPGREIRRGDDRLGRIREDDGRVQSTVVPAPAICREPEPDSQPKTISAAPIPATIAPPPPSPPQPARVQRPVRTLRSSGDPMITDRSPLTAHGWGTGGRK